MKPDSATSNGALPQDALAAAMSESELGDIVDPDERYADDWPILAAQVIQRLAEKGFEVRRV